MRLEWRERLAAHQPYGLTWELIDAELDFKINQWGQAPVHAMLSPTYATIHRTSKRRYHASLTQAGGAKEATRPAGRVDSSRTFDSLTKAKAWAQALVALDPPP